MKEKTYDGRENASVERVVRYLRENFYENGAPLGDERLLDLVIRQNALIRTAIIMGSFAYYPGDQIADAESLLYCGSAGDEEGEGR